MMPRVATRSRAAALCAVLILSSGPLPARASNGAEGAAFLDIPVGARPAALGGAYSAAAADGYAPVFNPAALAALDGRRLALTHLDHLEADYEFAGYAHPLAGAHGLGAAVQYYRPSRVAGYDAAGLPTGEFGGHFGGYTVAYGRGVSERASLGLSGKVVHAAIDGVKATAFAADLGGLYRPSRALSLALVLANVGSKLKFMEQGDDLPRTLRAGASWTPLEAWTLLLEGVYAQTAGTGGARAGAEWRPLELMALRLGYKSETVSALEPLAGLSAGVGIHWRGQEFSYAWVPHGDLGFTQHFSVAFRFGGPPLARAETGAAPSEAPSAIFAE